MKEQKYLRGNDLSGFYVSNDSERLTLETLTKENMSDKYIDWMQDPEILQYLEIRHAPKQTKKIVQKFVHEIYNSNDNLFLGIFLKDSKKHIGNVKLGPVHWIYKRAAIGILIGEKKFWGQGYATESIKNVTEIAYNVIGLHRVEAGFYENNLGSIKAFKKAGFVHEGLLKDYWYYKGEYINKILLGKIC